MGWPPTKEELDKLWTKMMEPPEPPVRYVSPKMYDVLESMVKDGLISGLPYSEFQAIDEFHRRMKEQK